MDTCVLLHNSPPSTAISTTSVVEVSVGETARGG
jgi:hypothetical protein